MAVGVPRKAEDRGGGRERKEREANTLGEADSILFSFNIALLDSL